jgi:hypothetical protein
MTSHAPHLPFSLDPLIAEAKRRARQRRVLVALEVLVLAGLAAGLTLAFRSPGGPSGGPLTGKPATARYPQDGFSLRYPSTWTRLGFCWGWVHPTVPTPFSLLTNARPAPTCKSRADWPQAGHLGTNVVSVVLARGTGFGGLPTRWNTHIAGRSAYAYSADQSTVDASSNITCPAGAGRADRHLMIRAMTAEGLLSVYATICGPNLVAGNTAVNRILASLRFTK